MKSLLLLSLFVSFTATAASDIKCTPFNGGSAARVEVLNLRQDGEFGYYRAEGTVKLQLIKSRKTILTRTLEVEGLYLVRNGMNSLDLTSNVNSYPVEISMNFLNKAISVVNFQGRDYYMNCHRSR